MSESPHDLEAATRGRSARSLGPDWTELVARLSEPFPASLVQWRAGTVSRDRKRAQALAYVDQRDYERRLDEVAPGGWSVVFRPWGESRLICELTIHGVTRASSGEFDDSDRVAQGTAAEAQAFKRACSKFGLGRYLYDLPLVWVDYDHERRRLLDTPQLSGRFVPQEGSREKPGARETPGQAPGRASGRRPSRARAQDGDPSAAAAEPPVAAPGTPTAGTPAAGTPAAGTPAAGTPAAGSGGDERLSAERAAAMQRELEKQGLARNEQRTFAAAVLGRRIGAFTELTDDEALEVWNAAKRTHHDVAV